MLLLRQMLQEQPQRVTITAAAHLLSPHLAVHVAMSSGTPLYRLPMKWLQKHSNFKLARWDRNKKRRRRIEQF
jgi:hypothetical protein